MAPPSPRRLLRLSPSVPVKVAVRAACAPRSRLAQACGLRASSGWAGSSGRLMRLLQLRALLLTKSGTEMAGKWLHAAVPGSVAARSAVLAHLLGAAHAPQPGCRGEGNGRAGHQRQCRGAAAARARGRHWPPASAARPGPPAPRYGPPPEGASQPPVPPYAPLYPALSSASSRAMCAMEEGRILEPGISVQCTCTSDMGI